MAYAFSFSFFVPFFLSFSLSLALSFTGNRGIALCPVGDVWDVFDVFFHSAPEHLVSPSAQRQRQRPPLGPEEPGDRASRMILVAVLFAVDFGVIASRALLIFISPSPSLLLLLTGFIRYNMATLESVVELLLLLNTCLRNHWLF